MWTHSDVAALLKTAQTANLLQRGEVVEPRPRVEAMLDRWERVVDDFIAEPGGERVGPLKAAMRELVQSVW